MWSLRAHLGDPRFHLVAALAILVLLFSGFLAGRDSTPCPACPGHEESASDCLCYHAPITPNSLPH